MGKTSKTTSSSIPTNTSSTFSINGTPLVSTTISDGNIYSNYNLSKTQQSINDYVDNSLLDGLANVNTFSPETIQNLNDQLSAYTNSGIKTINNTYTPMIQNLENDIASRFGNFDNSIFMDNLNQIETKRSDAISDFAQNVEAKKNELIDDQLDNQYKFLSFLTDYQNQSFQNMLDAARLNLSNMSANNSYQSDLNDSGSSYSSKLSQTLALSKISNYLSKLGSNLL